VLQIKPTVQERPHAADLNLTGGAISFNDVKFGYLPERPILDKVSIEVPAGKSLAIVGTSGSGKSTILRLLYRFFDAEQGSVSSEFSVVSTLFWLPSEANSGVSLWRSGESFS
jgi:ABC-type transport system involved in Fe-S cluster assembly fused permease/ATPase subunit